MKRILIIGAGGLGKEIADLIRDIGDYEIVGFIDDDINKKGTAVNNIPVLDSLEHLYKYKSVENAVIAIADPKIKDRIYEKIKDMGFKFPNLVHPTVVMGSNVSMGKGNIICVNSFVSVQVKLHDFVTVNPQCGIGHDCEIHSFSTLYWNVSIGGSIIINRKCELGAKSCVIQGLHLAENVILGAGAVVVRNICEEGTYVGVPAKKIK